MGEFYNFHCWYDIGKKRVDCMYIAVMVRERESYEILINLTCIGVTCLKLRIITHHLLELQPLKWCTSLIKITFSKPYVCK